MPLDSLDTNPSVAIEASILDSTSTSQTLSIPSRSPQPSGPPETNSSATPPSPDLPAIHNPPKRRGRARKAAPPAKKSKTTDTPASITPTSNENQGGPSSQAFEGESQPNGDAVATRPRRTPRQTRPTNRKADADSQV
ncbi:hypothetical protein BDZ91DRAFT_822639 [Kalaharituber pfeilii]|nr:hypothetical protein BDZ91DRAFT_822639 [Kalaharituber pfeilii]